MIKKIKAGDKAIHFRATDVNGKIVDSRKFNNKHLLIIFLRYAGCPWCNLAIHRLTFEQKLLNDSKCAVVAFVQSTEGNIHKNIYRRHAREPKFSVIADQAMAFYEKYGVVPSASSAIKMISFIPQWVHAVKKEGFKNKNIDGNLFIAPAFFLISGRNDTFIRAEYEANLYDEEAFSDIYRSIAEHELGI